MKFEYLTIQISESGKYLWQAQAEEPSVNYVYFDGKPHVEFSIQDILCMLGEDRWELVCITPKYSSSEQHFILKREKLEESNG